MSTAERKFTYVEMAYFQRWWDRLPESRREQVRMLYKRGQLEFNLGTTHKHHTLSLSLSHPMCTFQVVSR